MRLRYAMLRQSSMASVTARMVSMLAPWLSGQPGGLARLLLGYEPDGPGPVGPADRAGRDLVAVAVFHRATCQ